EAALERWMNSFSKVPNSGPEDYDTGRETVAIVSEARFAYLNCLEELRSLPNNAKRYNDLMLDYGKFLSPYNADEAIEVFESIVHSTSASSGLKSAASNAIARLKSLSQAPQSPATNFSHEPEPEPERTNSNAARRPIEVIEITDEELEPAGG
ncbi:hypothetical protein BVRB_026300, partial [Beta vulgaris subsp. vulgaris]